MEEETIVQESDENSIETRLREILGQLSARQLRYIAKIDEGMNKGEAAEAVGVRPNTAYKWQLVNEALKLIAEDRVATARALRRAHLLKAMLVKVEGLEYLSDEDKALRQRVASEIIEGELGRAAQPLTGADGRPMEHSLFIYMPDNQREDRD